MTLFFSSGGFPTVACKVIAHFNKYMNVDNDSLIFISQNWKTLIQQYSETIGEAETNFN